MDEHKLEVRNLSVKYSSFIALSKVSFNLCKPQLTTIIGPNGCGKTTLLKALTKIVKISSGSVTFDYKNLQNLNETELAKLVSFVPQEEMPFFNFTVYEMAAMGRTPFSGLNKLGTLDHVKIEDALKKLNLQDFAAKFITQLSGGERQRVLIARALIQDTPFIFLDEPYSHLDFAYEKQLSFLLRELSDMNQKIVLCVMHNLAIAKEISDRVILLKQGVLIEDSTSDKALSAENIEKVYFT